MTLGKLTRKWTDEKSVNAPHRRLFCYWRMDQPCALTQTESADHGDPLLDGGTRDQSPLVPESIVEPRMAVGAVSPMASNPADTSARIVRISSRFKGIM